MCCVFKYVLRIAVLITFIYALHDASDDLRPGSSVIRKNPPRAMGRTRDRLRRVWGSAHAFELEGAGRTM